MEPTIVKDLCLDAVDASGAAEFWAAALGLRASSTGGSDYVLTDGSDEHRLWVNQVPEPPTVKQRVHLDVNVAAVADLVDRGARVVDDEQPWTVLADLEGSELCAFVRPPAELDAYRFYELVVDAVDPARIARWWADRFGVEAHDEVAGGFSWLEPPGLAGGLVFQGVPEPKTVKNRIHWDVWGNSATLVEAGARLLRAHDGDRGWDVLSDPEGNEFCAFRPEEAAVTGRRLN